MLLVQLITCLQQQQQQHARVQQHSGVVSLTENQAAVVFAPCTPDSSATTCTPLVAVTVTDPDNTYTAKTRTT